MSVSGQQKIIYAPTIKSFHLTETEPWRYLNCELSSPYLYFRSRQKTWLAG